MLLANNRPETPSISMGRQPRTGGAAPFFTVLIPTMNRPEMCSTAVHSVLAQTCGDYELIVSDNSTETDTRRRTREALGHCSGDSRVRYIRPETFLSMPDHWEFMSCQATGEYVLILTDRHVMRPSALATLWNQIHKNKKRNQLISWHDHSQFDVRSGRVTTAPYTGGTWTLDSRQLASDYAAFSAPRRFLPRSLNSCYRSDIAAQIRKEHGRLFHPVTPDYTSAFLLLAYSDSVLHIDVPLYLLYGSTGNGLQCIAKGIKYYSTTLGTEIDALAGTPLPIDCVENTIIRDMLFVKHLTEPRLCDVQVGLPGYYLALLSELVMKERIGAQMDVSGMFDAWNAAVSELPASQRTLVAEQLATLLARRPAAPALVRLGARLGLHKLFHATVALTRRVSDRIAGKPTYRDVNSAARGTDDILGEISGESDARPNDVAA